jgi:GAF domain-containing protein
MLPKRESGRQAAEGNESEVLHSLLEVGVNFSAIGDRGKMLDMILREIRLLARAQAGSLYVCRGDSLRFEVTQNDLLDRTAITQCLLNQGLPLSMDSMAGFVAVTGQVVNIADVRHLPSGAPFRANLDFDVRTGYRTVSMLVLPLTCPDAHGTRGQCVGVLQLINCLDADGQVVPFPSAESSGIQTLAAMAAVTISNVLLQEQLKQAHLDSILRLSVAAEFRDDDTADHIRRISRSSALIAEEAGLDEARVEMIQYASPMHDIGKIGIPDAILRKPGPLTADQRRVVQKHTVIGADILAHPDNELIETAREVALSHHERWDGSGYPNGLAGEQIPITGRIVALADVFDALVSKRCYKEAYPLAKALDIIRQEDGKSFDPKLTAAFFRALDSILASYNMA